MSSGIEGEIYMSGMSLVTVLAYPSRPAPHEKQYTSDYNGLSPVTLQQPPSRTHHTVKPNNTEPTKPGTARQALWEVGP